MSFRSLSLSLLAFAAGISALVSCNESIKPDEPEITFDQSSKEVLVQPSIPADAASAESITFTATEAWRIQVSSETKAGNDVDWVSVSPDHGEAGTYTLSITVQKNTSAEPRSASIQIVCGEKSQDISITQLGAEIKPFGLVKRIKVEGSEWSTSVEHKEDGTDIVTRDPIDITYAYDSDNRVSSMSIKVGEDEIEQYEVAYKESTAVLSFEGETIELELDSNGRPSYFDGDILEYNEAGHLKSYTMYDDDYIIYLYKEGALIGAVTDSKDIEAKTEKYSPHLNSIYPNRIPASGSNIDLNMIMLCMEEVVPTYGLFVGGVSCGDYLMETPLFASLLGYEQDPWISGISDMEPGTVIEGEDGHFDYYGRYKYESSMFSSSIAAGEWTFNENQWPVSYKCDLVKDKYLFVRNDKVTDRVSTNEEAIRWYVEYTYPDEDPQEIINTHTFYEVESSYKRTLIKENVEKYTYSVQVEYY